jgi:hypothetical protein
MGWRLSQPITGPEATMATLHLDTKASKAKAATITQMVEEGTKAQPPALKGKMNECAKCGKETPLARYYIPRVGYSCEACWDTWRTTPQWCDTHASDVHRGCYYVPLGLFDLLDKAPTVAPVKPQDGRSANSTDALLQVAVGRLGEQQDARRAKEVYVKTVELCRRFTPSVQSTSTP